MTREQILTGMEVTYDCFPSLPNYKGVVTEVGEQERGGDCKVKWARTDYGPVVEHSSALREVTP